MRLRNFPEPGSAWPQCNGLSAAMAVERGLKVRWARALPSRLPSRNIREKARMHEDQVILLGEDNPDDEALTLRALKKNNITNKVVVARDGVEAIDYLFGTGTHTGRDISVLPQVILLDLKLPKLDGFEVLRLLRADERTRLLPVVILTTSNEEQDRLNGYGL